MTPDNRADGALAEAWCQPMGCGKHTPRVFLIRFEDTEVGDLTFTDEGEARDMFVKLNQNWNCYLMASLPLIPRPAEPAQAAQVEAIATYPHPGYGKPYPITTVLRDLASQEGCDGEPYDAMMFAAKTIDDMCADRKALVRSTLERAARVAKHRHEVWAAGDGFWDADGLPAVECDVTACDNIADAILALRTTPPPVSEYERKVAQMKEDFPNGI